jgi:hypothetical protein
MAMISRFATSFAVIKSINMTIYTIGVAGFCFKNRFGTLEYSCKTAVLEPIFDIVPKVVGLMEMLQTNPISFDKCWGRESIRCPGGALHNLPLTFTHSHV